MEKLIVATRTGGAMTYFSEDEGIYVPVGNPTAMRDAGLNTTPSIATATARAGQERFIRDDYSARGMVERYVTISKALLQAGQSGANSRHHGVD